MAARCGASAPRAKRVKDFKPARTKVSDAVDKMADPRRDVSRNEELGSGLNEQGRTSNPA